eukprot:TRINITY_DN14151_c0_g1_i1.p1 TRINITY_DN14151_c0_g1~~TRINITY_DN14151_c0_g1_i1.p1  ORF type:complete len:251 (+),score=36.11 TRINITY_DN14151_c0_g1_i1:36-788(+)
MSMFGVFRPCCNQIARTPLYETYRTIYVAGKYIKPNAASQKNFVNVKLQEIKDKNRAKLEADAEESVLEFSSGIGRTTIEAQMDSLKTKGFMRNYNPYHPPDNIQDIFLKICSDVLKKSVSISELYKIELTNPEEKAQILMKLYQELDHAVHNSRLIDMKTLEDVFTYYTTTIDMKTPYDRLHMASEQGSLPPNLCIQKDPHRFTGKSDHRLDQVTAFPRSPTIVSNIYSKKKNKVPETDLDIHSELDYD